MKHGVIELQTFRTIFICSPTFQRLRMDKIPLESVTVWSQEPMDVTKCCISSLGMLCQVLSCCLFVGLSPFCFVFNNWKACAVGLRSHDSVGYWKEPTSFPWETLAFAVSFGSLPICTLKCCPSSFQDLAKAEQRVQPCALHNILLLLSAVTLSVYLSDVVPVAALHASTMFDGCCAMLQLMNCFSPFPSFQLSVQYLWKLYSQLLF